MVVHKPARDRAFQTTADERRPKNEMHEHVFLPSVETRCATSVGDVSDSVLLA